MFDKAARALIRPPRAKYDFRKMPTTHTIEGFGAVQRIPVAFPNNHGETIFGSFYRDSESLSDCCVVYLHGNASNQLEGRCIVSLFVPVGVSVFCFDFAGCGCSTGKYISLGHREIDDVVAAVKLLRDDFGANRVALWGRSMGAAVSIMSMESMEIDPLVVVADSPFTSLKRVVWSFGDRQQLPHWLCKSVIKKVRKIVIKKANFDIYDVCPKRACARASKPLFLVHGKDDTLIDHTHSSVMFERSPSSEKELHIVAGAHDTDRPPDVVMKATVFVCRAFGKNVSFRRNDENEDTIQSG